MQDLEESLIYFIKPMYKNFLKMRQYWQRIFNVDQLKDSKNIPKTTWDLVNSEIGNSKTTQKGFEMDVNDKLTSKSITIELIVHNNHNN